MFVGEDDPKTPTNAVWVAPNVWPHMQSDEIHLWRVALDAPSILLERYQHWLDADERRRVGHVHALIDQQRFIAAHLALRAILARYAGSHPDALRFIYGMFGKPALAPGSLSFLRFNLAHSHDLAVCAVTYGREVGVDLEHIRPDAVDEEIVRQFFSAREQAELLALPADQRVIGFFNCWTRKEAYIKAHGAGLTLSLDSFDVTLTPGAPAALIDARPPPMDIRQWSLHDAPLGGQYAAAVVAQGHDWSVRYLRWNWEQLERIKDQA